ncbi:unnamed protein product [Anisakis simplex]|uniref:Protein AATF (inferred by orthology to a human protein) n=1 Tax=Anisakis simplex TaxID=6269 RepID=A0A0M3JKY3_ANISI|nr:unnamed protein product [Anisakis simplex]
MNGEDAEEDQEKIKVDDALTAVNLEAQRKKGESIRQQLLIWDRLLHLHIKLHAALRAYNQLPRGDLAKKLLKEADEETVKNYQQGW